MQKKRAIRVKENRKEYRNEKNYVMTKKNCPTCQRPADVLDLCDACERTICPSCAPIRCPWCNSKNGTQPL